MTAGVGSIGREALIAHQEFVLALARSLLRDEDAARDVAQETWLAALTRPPRSIASLRAWLAQVARSRAGDRLRRDLRRAEHERLAARAEAEDAGAGLRDRLALQHQVVEAVLALREPYRTTILRHHYEGLDAAEIARREGVPAGTVRARISRAHAALRERLDADFGGGRALWAGALVAWVERVGAPPPVAKAWIVGGGIVAAAAAGVSIVAWIATVAPETSVLAADAAAARIDPTPAAAEPRLDPPAGTGTGAPRLALLGPASSREAGEAEANATAQDASKAKKASETGVANGGFEGKAGKDGSIPDWKIVVGARNGAEEPLATAKLDTKEKRAGRASLCLSGDDTTRAWRAAQQEFEARPGGKYRLSAWAKAKDVRQETVKGTDIRQFKNCFVTLVFLDDNGEVVANDLRTPGLPTSGWQELEVALEAPESARTGMISVSLTMSGTLWIDEVALAVEGGHELPPKQVLVDEDFEKVTGLPEGWEEAVGATNGNGSKRSKIAVDRGGGAGGSHASLRFSGDKTTIQWMDLQRKFDAVPGDTFSLRAMARGENVRKEGVQFPNLHVRIVFLDADEKVLGAAKFAHPSEGTNGTFDWKEVTAAGSAPEGTVKALAGMFLSMSGDAWFDDLRVEKRSGGTPAYADWKKLETKHLVLRYPEDHPRAAEMKTFGERADRAYEEIVKRLEVDYTDTITMFLYRDDFQGKKLTGRELDFANPEGRAVHQRPNSTLSHEMAHCIALKMGTAQTGLLGEGIAVWLNGEPPESHHERAAKMLAKGELPSMKQLLEAFRAQTNGYPAAGSFCGYLIEMYGIAKFKELYPMTDPAGASNQVLGKGFDAVDEEWRTFLKGK
jgi:RNA polymerase sigma-70 factor (ECF subfamily)